MDDPMPAILGAVGAEFDVSQQDLLGGTRSARVVLARHTAMYLARRLTDMTYPEIGRAFNGRDHTTVISACTRVEQHMEQDDLYRRRVDTIRQFLEFMMRLI